MAQKITKQGLNQIKIAGWQKLSLIDYPGKMAAVIFLAGCNLRCHYCHNHHIWHKRHNTILFASVLEILRSRLQWLDAVVVSGGEPTMLPTLIPLLRALRSLGLLIKLDTNGTRPDVVQQVIRMGLVDYIALDVKAPAGKHVLITGAPMQEILTTVQLLKAQKQIPYMLRTTLSPFLQELDLIEIGSTIVNGAPYWQIQQCRVKGAYDTVKVRKMVALVKDYALHVVIKGV